MNDTYYTDSGNTIRLDKEIDKGGEGIIYLIHGYPTNVAKIYIKPQSAEVHRKILTMVSNPPHDPTVNSPTKHRSIAWPSDILYSDSQKTKFAGFIMPRIEMKVFRKILDYLSPDDRAKTFMGGFTWFHLYTTAYNLASCVAAIHERGYCIGDINESNILVQPTTPLTIIDCDSFQVKDPSSGKVWRCTVGKPEYTAPEIHGKKYEDVDRTIETDCFALGAIIFQLLMEGFHPYSARGRLVDDAPTTLDKIKKGIFPYGTNLKGISPPETAPPLDILNSDIQNLFKKCFDIGHKNPQARPSAKEWMVCLKKYSQNFRKCSVNENHRYLDHLNVCPWCERGQIVRKDSFPSSVGQQIVLPGPNNQMISKKGAILTPGSGIPVIGINKLSFEFYNIQFGKSVSDTFQISNEGGGILSGSIKSNRKWIQIAQSNIDTKIHKQNIAFSVDSAGLPLGFKDSGQIEITSTGGSKIINVSISVEVPEAAISRYRVALTAIAMITGGLLGILIATYFIKINIKWFAMTGMATIVTFFLVPFAGFISGKKAGKASLIVIPTSFLILAYVFKMDSLYSMKVISAFCWALIFGAIAQITAKPTFVARAKGIKFPYPFIIGCFVITIALYVSNPLFVIFESNILGYYNKILSNSPKLNEKQNIAIVSTGGIPYKVARNNAANVRIRPSNSADIIGIVNISKGNTIGVLEKSSDWLKIKVRADGKENFGWIHKSFFISKDENSKAAVRNESPSRTNASIAHIRILRDSITEKIENNKPVESIKVAYSPPIFYYFTYEGAVPSKTTAQVKLYDNETLLWEGTNFILAYPSGYYWVPIGYNFTKINFPFYNVKLFIDGEQKSQIGAAVFPK